APTYDAPTYDAPTYDAPAYDAPAYDAPAYETPGSYEMPTSYDASPYEPSYETAEDPLGLSQAGLDSGSEPELAWSMPAAAAPAPDAPAGWSEPSWAEAAEPAPFVPPVHLEPLSPAPLAPMPEPPPVPLSDPPVAAQPPAVEPPYVDTSQTSAGLARRIPLTNMSPQIAAPDHALADDVASQPTPDRSRHLFAAYRDGLTLGRGGLDDDGVQPDGPQGEVPR
ncbi:MAG: hypothetical protein ACRDTP_10745, partial [Mycobacteriales bacterium]